MQVPGLPGRSGPGPRPFGIGDPDSLSVNRTFFRDPYYGSPGDPYGNRFSIVTHQFLNWCALTVRRTVKLSYSIPVLYVKQIPPTQLHRFFL